MQGTEAEDYERIARPRPAQPSLPRRVQGRDGETPERRLRKLKPDIILTDFMIPEMDDFMLFTESRKLKEMETIPAFALTASGMKETMDEIRAYKFGGLIVKPFDNER